MESKFSDRLKSILQKKNMKQTELAEKSGIGKSAISQYMSGKYEPKLDNLNRMAKALNVSLKELLDEDPFEYMCRKSAFPEKYLEEVGKEEPFENSPTEQEQLLNTISFCLHNNSAAGLSYIENSDKVVIIKDGGKVIAKYRPEIIIEAYLLKEDKNSFSLEDLESYTKQVQTTPANRKNYKSVLGVPRSKHYKEELISLINDHRLKNNMTKKEVVDKLKLEKWIDDKTPLEELEKIAKECGISLKKRTFTSLKPRNEPISEFYQWFKNNINTLTDEEIKLLKADIKILFENIKNKER